MANTLLLSGVGGAGAFSPNQIANLVLWLRADAGTWKDAGQSTPASADGDQVYTWTDQSGNGNNGVQATAAQRPVLKLNIQNGLPVLRFASGSSQFFSLGTNVASLAITGDLSIVAVTQKTTAATAGRLVSYQTNLTRTNAYEFGFTSQANPPVFEFVHASGASFDDFGSTSTAADNAFHELAVIRSGSNISFFLNNAAASSNTATVTPTTDSSSQGMVGNRAGGNQFLPGDIGELLVYGHPLTSTERANLDKYLNTRWALH